MNIGLVHEPVLWVQRMSLICLALRRSIVVGLLTVPLMGPPLVAGAQDGSPAGSTPRATTPTSKTYRGWQVESYGPVARKEINGGIDLESTTSPGGLFFRQALGSANTYRLTIEGHAIAGQATVRLTLDGTNPQWFPAADGLRTLTISGGRSIEVVVQSDMPYTYHLRNLQFEACPDCQTAAAVLAATFSGWETEPFGPVEQTPAEQGIRLGSLTARGGLIFRRSVDPARTYRLTIDGQPIAGQTTARLKVGEADPEWFPAPNGQQFVNLSGNKAIELVVYSDTPFS